MFWFTAKDSCLTYSYVYWQFDEIIDLFNVDRGRRMSGVNAVMEKETISYAEKLDEANSIEINSFLSDFHGVDIQKSRLAAIELTYFQKEGVLELTNALQSHQAHVAAHAALALGIIGHEARSATYSLSWALQQKDTGLRENAAAALGRIVPSDMVAIVALGNALQDSALSVRQYASAALCEFGSKVNLVETQLTQAINDEDEHVREFVLQALSNMNV